MRCDIYVGYIYIYTRLDPPIYIGGNAHQQSSDVQRRQAAVAATLACYWGRKCSAAKRICSARISSFATLQAKPRDFSESVRPRESSQNM